MTLPNGITTCIVTFGRATSYLGNDAVISGTLSADRTVIHSASGVRVGSGDDVVPNDSGFLSFPAPHVNQTGFVDASGEAVVGWLYILTGTITYQSGKVESFRRTFQVLVGQTTVDLDLIPDGPVMPGFTAPAGSVTSVAGRSGSISAETLAADLEGPLSDTFVTREEYEEGGSGGGTPSDLTDLGYDVVLLLGQSNMVGSTGEAVDTLIDIKDPRVWSWGASATVITQAVDPLAHRGGVSDIGPGMPFARWYAESASGNRRTLLVSAAASATGFASSTQKWDPNLAAGSNNLYAAAIAQAEAAMTAAGPNARLTAILWCQGETDAQNSMAGTTYRTFLEQLIDGLRDRLDAPDVPFLIGQMLPEFVTAATGTTAAIHAVHVATPTRKAHTAFVAMPAGLSRGDGIHYSRDGQREFGRRFAAALPVAIANDAPVNLQPVDPPDLPPEEPEPPTTLDPDEVAGLAFWADSTQESAGTDGVALATVTDWSTSGRDLGTSAVGKPILRKTGSGRPPNGNPYLEFTGPGEFREIHNTVSTPVGTLFVVMRSDTAVSFGGVVAGATSGSLYAMNLNDDASAWESVNFPVVGNFERDGIATTSVTHDGSWHIYSADAAGAAGGGVSQAGTLPNGLMLGSDRNVGSRYLDGGIAEVVTYSRVLDEDEKAAVTEGLRTKYGTP